MSFDSKKLFQITMLVLAISVFSFACSQKAERNETQQPTDTTSTVEITEQVIEKSGSIEEGDLTDPNHMNFPYDAYNFEAVVGDKVRIEVTAEAFTALLKLVEVSTGAVLAEWDSEYPTGDALIYVIASNGSYEARVYSTNSGTGEYSVKIVVE